MLFNSYDFAFFLIITITVYQTLPAKFRSLILLIASYLFYMAWNPYYIILIVFSTLIDYTAGLKIASTENSAKRKIWFGLSLTCNLLLLFTFKYYNFFSGELNEFLGKEFMPIIKVLLPVGISFYTFQTISYTYDVYRKRIDHETNVCRFALYVSFFPQLVAGPIERAQNLLPQLQQPQPIRFDRIRSYGWLILWGLFQKCVISDNLAPSIDLVFSHVVVYSPASQFWATIFFTFQLYCDFAGYSNIAIGVAGIFGVHLMKNFNRPFWSVNMSEFWGRWHISLSSWFRDHVYIPLGGNRNSRPKWIRNLFIVFILSGFWHGANWTFMIWGLLHGVYLLIHETTNSWRRQHIDPLFSGLLSGTIYTFLRRVYVFFLFGFSLIFFRSGTVAEAKFIIRQWGASLCQHLPCKYSLYPTSESIPPHSIIYCVFLILSFLFFEWLFGDKGVVDFVSSKPQWIRWLIFYTILFTIVILIHIDNRPFIYFQF